MKKQLAYVASAALTAVAAFFVTVASAWMVHQPEVPNELLKR